MLTRRHLLSALAVLGSVPRPVWAQAWSPAQPIRLIIPYSTGGGSDIVGRVLAEPIQRRLGQPLVSDNRPGAATQIGTTAVVRSKPDGLTLLLVANTLMVNPTLFKTLPYDTLKDLEPVTYAGVTPHVLLVNNEVPARSVKELLAYAKVNPGKLSYGSVGNGTSFHLGMEEFKKRTGTHIVHIPYGGMGKVLTDLMGNSIQLAFANAPNAAPLLKSGKLRALGLAHPNRVTILPGVPTLAEEGLPGLESNSAYIIMAAAGTPEPILNRLQTEFVDALNEPAIKTLLTEQGIEVVGLDRAKTASFIRREMTRYAELVRFSGATVD